MDIEPKEYEEQCEVVAYLERLKESGTDVEFSATAQSTWTSSWGVKIKNKKLGVRRGIPDLIIIIDSKLIMIEMKRKTKGRLDENQKRWIEKLKSAGVATYVCRGADEAIQVINKYVDKK
jgi:L-lactate utilization protein LutB